MWSMNSKISPNPNYAGFLGNITTVLIVFCISQHLCLIVSLVTELFQITGEMIKSWAMRFGKSWAIGFEK